MNRKLHILFAFIIVFLFLVGCAKNNSIDMPQQNQNTKIVVPPLNGEITKSPEAATPTMTNSTSDTIDYNQYTKKTWIKSNNNASQENGVSFIISKIENKKMTGELTVVGQGQSCPNTVADLNGTINNDTVNCHFIDSRDNEGNIKLIFKPNDTIDATITLTNKSEDDIAQTPEGTFQFVALNLKDKKEFSPIEEQSFIVELNSWGEVRFVSGKFTLHDYVPVGFYLTAKDGDILYNFDYPINYDVDIKAVSFNDVNKDGLKDIIIIASSIENSDNLATIFLQYNDQSFRYDPKLDEEINDSGSNKDIKSVTDYLSQKLIPQKEVSSDDAINLVANKENEEFTDLKSWIGYYSFLGYSPNDEEISYNLYIYQENKNYYANILIEGFQTHQYIKAIVTGDDNAVDFIFDKYLLDNISEPYKKGDALLSLKKDNSELITNWGKILHQNDSSSNETISFVFISTDQQYKYLSNIQWKQAYINYIYDNLKVHNWHQYELICLDDDAIPELVALGDSEAGGNLICNYYDGEVHSTSLLRLGFDYIERGNLLCNSDGHMDNYYDIVYSIIDGKLVQTDSGYWGELDDAGHQFDEDGNLIYQYSWNGVSVTEEKYNKCLNLVFDMSKATDGYTDHSRSEDEIIKEILNY